jgi:CRP-like cAMP-binding protein
MVEALIQSFAEAVQAYLEGSRELQQKQIDLTRRRLLFMATAQQDLGLYCEEDIELLNRRLEELRKMSS